ncbi:MAG TPA: ATP-dependent helicase HrpB [Nitrospirales bacterium]|nr:ATP-dependent helicase HrpB [Nitrospirales bacterium]
MKRPSYPIDAVVPQLRQTLNQQPIVLLTAQPGAGKTTQIPLALLQEPWLTPKTIIMLEPRRLAARAAARRMSDLLGEAVGTTVGYRTRLDTKISPNTKLEVVTEGILTRILQHDPSLESYGLVIFDEFHERSLQADLGLALCLESRKVFREDLRLLIMSATLDIAAISQQLKQAPVVTCEGTMFPVETRYVGKPDVKNFAIQVAQTIHRLLKTEPGNLLVFLPGAGEIRRIERILADLPLGSHILIAPLYGDLSAQAQDQAILPPPPGWRKVVLATNIAESSLTIEGIRLVIDTGLMRIPRFDSRSGMSRLTTLTVSQQSAEQRRGRAGRLEPGLCMRLWSEAEQRTFTPRTAPEILDADLTSLALELAQWGIQDPQELLWLDSPPSGAMAQARQLLHSLGAFDAQGHITDHGRSMAELPMHPRLAHMVLKGKELDSGALACDLAASLSERDLFKGSTAREHADLRARFDVLYGSAHAQRDTGFFNRGTLQRIRQVSQAWQRTLHITTPRHVPKQQIDQMGVLLALAYPDRIAQRQSDEARRYRLANGRSARFHHPDPLEHEEWLVIADLNGAPATALIYMAVPISREDLITHCGDLIQSTDSVMWDGSTQTVRSIRQRRLGELILEESRLPDPDPDLVLTVLLEGLRNTGLPCLPWTPTLRNWQARVQFLRRVTEPGSTWPDVSDDTLLHTLDQWLGPYLTNLSSLNQLKRIDLAWPLQALLSPEQRQTLDTLAPTHLTVPTGSHIPLDYLSGEIPVLAVRLQEIFGQCDTPRLVNGKVPVLIHLLSPARRPVQVTQDLTSFWATGYQAVKKELKGRYPKHFWPDDPLQAPPTRGIKKR